MHLLFKFGPNITKENPNTHAFTDSNPASYFNAWPGINVYICFSSFLCYSIRMTEFGPTDTTTLPIGVLNRLRTARRSIALALGVLTLAAGCTSQAIDTNNPDISSSASTAASETPAVTPTYDPYEHAKCDAPDKKDIRAVTKIFNSPETPAVKNLLNNYTDIEQGLTDIRKDAAKKHGLTIFDYRSEFEDLSKDLYAERGSKLSYETYFKRAKGFAARYGVTLKIADSQDDLARYDDSVLTEQDLKDENVKYSLYSLIKNLGEMPVELVRYIGLKNIVLVKISDPDTGGWADIYDGKTYYVDPKKPSGDAFNHEAFHLWDAKKCGAFGIFADVAYNSLNPRAIYNNSNAPNSVPASTDGTGMYIDGDEMLERTRELREEAMLAETQGNYKKAKKIKDDIKDIEALVIVTRDLGLKNIAEDKATIGGEKLFNPFTYSYALDKSSPIIRKKALFILGRIFKDKPEIVRYFADISHRP